MCRLVKGRFIQTSEHPLTLSEETANISAIADRISEEGFSGAPMRLLNAKNIPLPDVAGTKGNKLSCVQ